MSIAATSAPAPAAPAGTAPGRPGAGLEARAHDAQLPATLCLAALTVATVISLCRVFPDWEYLRTMVLVTVGVHAVAALLRVARTPLLVALPALLLAVVELIALGYYRDTLVGPFPGSRTIELMRLDLRLVVDQFPTAVAPVPSVGSYAVAAAVALALCVVMADTFAFRAMGRVEATVPTAVVFIFTAALGTDRHRVAVAALWLGMAFLTVAVLRFRHTGEAATWMGSRTLRLGAALPAIAATVALTAVAAAAIAPRLPGAGEKALVDTRNRDGGVTEVLSPLVDIRSQLVNRGNVELFTVSSSDGAHNWRVMGLPNFDGNAWNAADEPLVAMGNRENQVPLPGSLSTQVITITGLGGNVMPAAYHPVEVFNSDMLWAAGAQTLVRPDGGTLQSGEQIVVVSKVVRPTAELLRAATVDNAPDAVYYQMPPGLPESARSQAVTVTASAATPFEKALALQNWFQSEFVYDIDFQAGNSNDAIDAFLRVRRGFCQQFSGTFAAMARSIGLPARVATGFTPGDLGADGLYHVYGRHYHAWPEVWFDGIGWVGFEPTPGRGNIDSEQYTGVPTLQDNSGGTGTGTPVSSAPVPSFDRPGDDPNSSSTVPGGTGQGTGTGTTTTVVAAGGGGSSGGGVPYTALLVLAALAAAIAWIVFAPRVVRSMATRHHHGARDRVIGAWQRSLASLSLAGAPPPAGLTPLEYADIAERSIGVDQRAMRELAVQVTRAVYSPKDMDDQAASRCESLGDEIAAICSTRIPMSTRVRALVDPRLMRQRLVGNT